MLLLLLACTSPPDSADDPVTPGTFRVAFIADTHVIGPQYVCCSESEGLDNESIMKTPDRLAAVVDQLNAVNPPPEAVFVLGDVVHDAHVFDSLDAYEAEETAWSRAAALFDGLDMPVHLVWGNHDYDVDCGEVGDDRRLFTHDLFDRFFGAEPTKVVDLYGWRFILANSQLGPTWDAVDGACSTGTGSFGAAQLTWLDEQLGEGRPSVVMSHHYLPVTRAEEDPAGLGDYESVLSARSNMKLSLAGHAHRWIDFTPSYGFPHILLGATRYDTDDFWIVEFSKESDAYTILDFDKARWLTTCADTWVYDGTPAPDPANPAETGDCGN
jgi:3',5'-cyclic AMP phosphodiesterase CpdA